jgi:IMP dehydrogenase
MIKAKDKEALCFDDILLVPQKSSIVSRRSVDITMHDQFLPIVSSPMDTVTGWQMATEIADAGGIGIIHRYMSDAERLSAVDLAVNGTRNPQNVGMAISAAEVFNTQLLDDAYDLGCSWICIDTANGHGDACIKAVSHLKKYLANRFKIMAGNVSTAEGFIYLAQAGADAVRVGIGGGATCTTRIVSGHGVPTLQSIMDCYEAKNTTNTNCLIVADGGIKTTGDMVKAFAAGADLVMLGSFLAGTDEAPGEAVDGFKAFRGMASPEAQQDWRGSVSVAEGITTKVPLKGPVSGIIDTIIGGLGSGCSYSGVQNLSDLAKYAEYIKVSPLSRAESLPHGK